MIPSFEIDHTKLLPGVYVSRVDDFANRHITTLDLRVCRPNVSMMKPEAAHTIEHLIADYLRNRSLLKDVVIYFGPMGCMTGFYLVLKGDWKSVDAVPYLLYAFKDCLKTQTIPGNSEKECGNYLYHDLQHARQIMEEYVTTLENCNETSLNYPR